GEGRAWMRFAAHAHDRSDQSGLFAADECSCADTNFQIKAEICSENVLAQKAKFTGQCDRDIERLYGDWIFCTAVDVAITRTHCVSADDHPFDHRVRIAFEHAAVHECTGVAFICITDHVFGTILHIAGDLPLPSSWEAGAAASA